MTENPVSRTLITIGISWLCLCVINFIAGTMAIRPLLEQLGLDAWSLSNLSWKNFVVLSIGVYILWLSKDVKRRTIGTKPSTLKKIGVAWTCLIAIAVVGGVVNEVLTSEGLFWFSLSMIGFWGWVYVVSGYALAILFGSSFLLVSKRLQQINRKPASEPELRF